MADLRLCEDSYQNPALAAAAQQSMNLYRETYDGTGGGSGKSTKILTGSPGYSLLATSANGNIRGMWSGGGRLFVMSGSHIMEYSEPGNVLSDEDLTHDDGNPVYIFGNGNQLGLVYTYVDMGLVTGNFLINNGAGFRAAQFQLNGNVTVSGSSVTQNAGDLFTPSMSGNIIVINQQNFTFTYSSSTTGTISPAFPSGVGFGSLDFSGAFAWVSGDKFPVDGSFNNLPITIAGNSYIIDHVISDQYLQLQNPNNTTFPPAFNVAYTVVQPVMAYSAAGGDFVTAVSGAYLDGSFYVQRPSHGSPDLGRQVNYSGLNAGGIGDGTIWNGLDFFTKEAAPDYIKVIFADREQLYVLGTETSEAWQVNQTTGIPERINGAVFKEGLMAKNSVVSMNEHLYYLGGSPLGGVVAYRLDGFTPTRVSTHAVEEAWATSGAKVDESVSWNYIENGHFFWVIGFKSGSSWVYDATERSWHERAKWTGTAFAAYPPFYHTFIPEWGTNGRHVIGDHSSGKIWFMDSQTYSEDGHDAKRVRVMPYIFAGGNKRVYCDRVDLTMATGLTSSMTAPKIELAWSEDDGKTFSTDQDAGYGAAGQTETRVFWFAQGSAETAMMPRISVTGQNEIVLIAADGEVAGGTT